MVSGGQRRKGLELTSFALVPVVQEGKHAGKGLVQSPTARQGPMISGPELRHAHDLTGTYILCHFPTVLLVWEQLLESSKPLRFPGEGCVSVPRVHVCMCDVCDVCSRMSASDDSIRLGSAVGCLALSPTWALSAGPEVWPGLPAQPRSCLMPPCASRCRRVQHEQWELRPWLRQHQGQLRVCLPHRELAALEPEGLCG